MLILSTHYSGMKEKSWLSNQHRSLTMADASLKKQKITALPALMVVLRLAEDLMKCYVFLLVTD